jgi:pyruvate dehydrogenase E2 component (dihydrolipoamide acetyltransferase)
MADAATLGAAPIVMPKLGLSMSEGRLAEWLVRAGDDVAAGQPIFVVETDKITNEVEAPAAGRILRIVTPEGDTVDVGATVALWTGPGQGGASRIAAATAETAPVPGPNGATRVLATPLARRLAVLGAIPLTEIPGTGPRQRIQARDVRAALEQRRAPAPPAARWPEPQAATPKSEPTEAIARDLRPIIAARVIRSMAEIPHFYVTADALFDPLIALRGQLNADAGAARKFSVTAFIATAIGQVLAATPQANVVWREGRNLPLGRVALGVAVDTPGGVLAPVVPFAPGESLYGMARALDLAIDRARTGRLRAEDMGEAAMGVSNVGMLGVRALAPIIDPDQTFMLGVGAPRAVFRPGADGSPKPAREATLTLACDHRAIDGAGAARFLAAIVDTLEHPLRLLIPRA